ncbi:MAG: DUF6531 domain-containing protein [Chlamydiales bacterium]|nr:DUF6531 domain-containing protein [Chlamydiales bacterium]
METLDPKKEDNIAPLATQGSGSPKKTLIKSDEVLKIRTLITKTLALPTNIMRLLFSFFCSISLGLYAESPSEIVAGCVNILTGSYTHTALDFALPGPEPLTFQRIYCSGDRRDGFSLCDNWTYNHPKEAIIAVHNDFYRLIAPEPTGTLVNYVTSTEVAWDRVGRQLIAKYPPQDCHGDQQLALYDRGITEDLKNQTADFLAANQSMTINLCNGGIRRFERLRNQHIVHLPGHLSLTEEIRPNGHLLRYEHTDDHVRLSKITLCNEADSLPFASLTFDYSDCMTGSIRCARLRSIDGREAAYTFRLTPTRLGLTSYLIEANTPNSPLERYSYLVLDDLHLERLRLRQMPEGRFQQIDYYVNNKSLSFGKVYTLKVPGGPGNSVITTHHFLYGPGQTEMRDAHNNRTVYRFGNGTKLDTIERYLGRTENEFRKYSTRKFFWGARCNLLCNALLDERDNVVSCKYFDYDANNKIIAEHLLGPLSGTNHTLPVLSPQGTPYYNGCESHVIRKTYSQDKYGLLLSEEQPNDSKILYGYKLNSNILESVKTVANGKILKREFYQHDDQANVIAKIVDDGSGDSPEDLADVMIRKITRTTPRKTFPYGLPEVESEYFYDPEIGFERHVTTKINSYSNEGWMTEQVFYDANDTHQYTLQWQYDRLGNVIWEQNSTGAIIQRRFDANGNKVYEKPSNSEEYQELSYDCMNRLIGERHVCADGQAFEQHYHYDLLGNRIASTDSFGNTTSYRYDDLCRLIATTLPPNDQGQQATERLEYDVVGNITAIIDAQGNHTHKKYNARNQITQVEYPDGSTESYEYNLDGTLRHKKALNGCWTQFTYDGLGNTTRKETASGVTTATYKGNLLTSETDANGSVTQYQYDNTGLLIKFITPSGWSSYEYDDKGNLSKTIKWIGPDITDVCTIANEPAHLNENVESSPTLYNYNYQNERGQRVLQTTSVDSLGNQVIITYDALGRPVCNVTTNASGIETSCHRLRYDLLGRLQQRIDIVKAEDLPDREVITEWQYDSMGRLTTHGTPHLKQSYYNYNRYGQKEAEITPDGTVLRYIYDSQGRLSNFSASDASINYHYSYDANGNLIACRDNIQGTETKRRYDNANRLIHETLANGLSLAYEYDGLDRMIKMVLPDGSAVFHVYDESYLLSVERLTSNNVPLYRHDYIARDAAGRILESKMIKGAGTIQYSWDDAGRLKTLYNAHYEESVPDDGYNAAGKLIKLNRRDQMDEALCQYEYDDLYHLTREVGVAQHTYSYNSINNRLSKDGLPCQLNDLGQILQHGDSRYTYDPAGFRLSDSHRKYHYDAIGRLVEMQSTEGRWIYTYDAFNRCMSKMSYDALGDVVDEELYFYCDQTDIGATDKGGSLRQFRMIGEDTVAIEINANLYAPIQDRHGNIVALLSAADGKVREAYRHSMLGEEIRYTSSLYWRLWHRSTAPAVNPWRFGGNRVEPETGFVRTNKGFYDPESGSFLTTQ